jgi:hypothetical protein
MLTLMVCCFGWRPWHVQIRGCCHWREDESIKQFVLFENNFGLMDVWELNPQRIWPLWFRLLRFWKGGLFWLRVYDFRRTFTFFSYTVAFGLQLRKSVETLSQCSSLVLHWSLRRLGRLCRGSVDWPAEHQSSVARRRLQAALAWYKCLPSRRTKGLKYNATDC